jgi:long-chain acyl-CoA synthetase
MPEPEQWFQADAPVHRFVTDLVAGELACLRPGGELPALPWPGSLSLGGGGLDCDSLEMLSLAAAVAEATHMHRSGVEDYLLARRTIGDWVAIVATSLEHFSGEVTFRSSGTTGVPTSSPHELGRLVQEIRELARLFPERRRLLCAVPAHHIYGFLFSVLLPAELGVPVIDIRGRSTAGLAGELRAGDLVVGHPVFWEAFTRTVPTVPAGVLGVTSTAPCPIELAVAVVDQGLERLVQVYGSSETSGIGWRDVPDGDYFLLAHWRRGDETSLVGVHPDGSETHHAVPRLIWSDSRRFQVAGRRDGAVQVGGINVIPSTVGARLREHPAVSEAVVRAMRPDEGARLKAFIVPRDDRSNPSDLTAELADWCDAHLTVAERPKSFTFGESLPRGELGKLADWPLPGQPSGQ